MFFLSFLVSLLLLLWGGAALGGDVTITTPQGLIDFSNNVTSGNTYSGATVYLGSDLDFTPSLSSQFIPIGDENNYFSGTFDGQGHVISNLIINSNFSYVGLFGHSYESNRTIRSVIMGESCSVVNSHKGYSDVGSIVGYCSRCLIENVVNMASVSFTGDSSSTNFCISGIVGRLVFSGTVRNCVNYGSVTHSGISIDGDAYIGGIAGLCGGNKDKSIENCANYGTLTHNGTSSNLYMGGVVGYNYYGTVNIENCVCGGKIFNITSGSGNNCIGSIVGYILFSSATTDITHCFWTSDVGYDTVYGYVEEEPGTSLTVTDNSLIELNTTIMNELNTYANSNSWNKWFMLHPNERTISNDVNQEILIVTQKYFPEPVKEGRSFLFWCTDLECTGKYYPNSTDIIGITDLYAVWDVNTIVFIFGNGTIITKDMTYGEVYGDLPDAEKEGDTLIGWFTEENGKGEEITSETVVESAYSTLYAHWTINNYTLAFIFNNGESDEIRIVDYSEAIVYPNDPMREGYKFNGWDYNITTMPAHNLNITALWTEITEVVEIVFGKKDMKKEEIKEIINRYTNESFTIKKVEIDEITGETKVIVNFNDKKTADNFVEQVKQSSDSATKNVIKKVGFANSRIASFSVPSSPSILSLFAFYLFLLFMVY